MKLIFALSEQDYGDGLEHTAIVTTEELYADNKTLPSDHILHYLPQMLNEPDEIQEGVFIILEEYLRSFCCTMLSAGHKQVEWWI